MIGNLRGAPDRDLAIKRYRSLASGYDSGTRFVIRMRRLAVELLGLRQGDVVFDIACGTGPMLADLAQRVKPRGRVIGIEQSPEMIAIARERVRREDLGDAVTLIEAAAEEVCVEEIADALVFFYTHDVLQSPRALDRLFRSARPGARVVAAGARFRPAWWAPPLNLWTAWRARKYLTTYRGLLCPWRDLQRHCPDFHTVAGNFLGSGYIGVGTFEKRAFDEPVRRMP